MATVIDESPQAGAAPQPQQPNPTQVSQGAQAPSFGTQYIGIGDYLKANQGQGQAMTQNAVGNINQQGQKTKQSISDLQKAEIAQWKKEDSDFMTASIADPSKLDAAGIARYKALNATLQNPLTPLDQKANATAAQSGVTQVQGQRAKGVRNIGNSFLDQAIGVGEGGQSAIQDAIAQYSGVDQQYKDVSNARTQAERDAEDFRAAEASRVGSAYTAAQTAATTADTTRKNNLRDANTAADTDDAKVQHMMKPFMDYENTDEYRMLDALATGAPEWTNSRGVNVSVIGRSNPFLKGISERLIASGGNDGGIMKDAEYRLRPFKEARAKMQAQAAQMSSANRAKMTSPYATESPLLAQLRALTGS